MAEQKENTVETPESGETEQQSAGVEPDVKEMEGGEDTEKEESLESEIEEARREAEEHKDRLLRLAAEFENYKKRIEREKSIALKYAEEDFLKEMLPTLDNMGRAIEECKKDGDASDLLAGVELTYNVLLNTLQKFGLEPIESVGQTFDPNFHEALAMEASDEMEENNVMLEYEKGYMYKDRLLRAAKVVVSKGNQAD